MSVSRIAARYAKPLLDLAIEQKELDGVLSDVKSIKSALENRDLFLLMKSPIIKADKKLSIAKAIFQGKVNKTVFSFIELIIKKGRENLLPEIVDEFINEYKIYKKITTVTLITAKELAPSELEAIKAKLLASEITEESLEVHTKVDENIIGGFIIKIGDKLYDASVLHKLEEIRKKISSDDYVKAY